MVGITRSETVISSNPALLNSFVGDQNLKRRGGTKACGNRSSRPGPRGVQHIVVLVIGPTYVGVPENNLLPQKLVFILIIFIKRNVYLGSYLGSRSSFHTHPFSKNRVQPMQWNVRDMLT